MTELKYPRQVHIHHLAPPPVPGLGPTLTLPMDPQYPLGRSASNGPIPVIPSQLASRDPPGQSEQGNNPVPDSTSPTDASLLSRFLMIRL